MPSRSGALIWAVFLHSATSLYHKSKTLVAFIARIKPISRIRRLRCSRRLRSPRVCLLLPSNHQRRHSHLQYLWRFKFGRTKLLVRIVLLSLTKRARTVLTSALEVELCAGSLDRVSIFPSRSVEWVLFDPNQIGGQGYGVESQRGWFGLSDLVPLLSRGSALICRGVRYSAENLPT
ncbi:hypothetical protein U1Q18_043871 [Sarracenia purpurea var. burkii]